MTSKLALAVCLWLATSSAGAAVLFQDNFDTGPDDAWAIPNGGWQWEAGRFLNTSRCGFQTCMSPLFGGVIYLLVGMSGPALFDAGNTTGYLLDSGYGNHGGILFQESYPATELAADWTGLWHLAVGVTYTIEFGKSGDQVFARIYDAGSAAPDWQLRATDARPGLGWCGFSTWHTVGYLDNVVVTGNGVVAEERTSWGALKGLFR